MGLDDIGDMEKDLVLGGPKGGRGNDMEQIETAFLPGKDSKEWWIDIILDTDAIQSEAETGEIDDDEVLKEFIIDVSDSLIRELAGLTHISPVDVRKKLSEHGLYETDWERYKEGTDEHLLDARVPGIHVSRGTVDRRKELPDDGAFSNLIKSR